MKPGGKDMAAINRGFTVTYHCDMIRATIMYQVLIS